MRKFSSPKEAFGTGNSYFHGSFPLLVFADSCCWCRFMRTIFFPAYHSDGYSSKLVANWQSWQSWQSWGAGQGAGGGVELGIGKQAGNILVYLLILSKIGVSHFRRNQILQIKHPKSSNKGGISLRMKFIFQDLKSRFFPPSQRRRKASEDKVKFIFIILGSASARNPLCLNYNHLGKGSPTSSASSSATIF